MARLPILVRQSQVFDLVVTGKSYADICVLLDISEDTVARDMAAISQEVATLCRDRLSEILAVALAHLEAARDAAWVGYRADLERKAKWFAGELDYPTSETSSKETANGFEKGRKTGSTRPAWRSSRGKWLDLVVSTTREICALVGLKRLLGADEDGGELVVRVEYAD